MVSYELLVSDGDISAIREGLVLAAAQLPIDVAIQPDGLERRAKRMVIMDVDSDPDPARGDQPPGAGGRSRGAGVGDDPPGADR